MFAFFLFNYFAVSLSVLMWTFCPLLLYLFQMFNQSFYFSFPFESYFSLVKININIRKINMPRWSIRRVYQKLSNSEESSYINRVLTKCSNKNAILHWNKSRVELCKEYSIGVWTQVNFIRDFITIPNLASNWIPVHPEKPG